MAFAAVITLQRTIQDLMKSSRIILVSPNSVQIMRVASEALESLQATLERLDKRSKSCSRKKVNALDSRIKEAMWKLEDVVESNLSNQILPQLNTDGGGATPVMVNVEELEQDVGSFNKILKMMEEEYIYELDHLPPEEAAASSKTYPDAKEAKLVGSSDLPRKIKRRLSGNLFISVAIMGMAGIGKTCVAKEVFDDSLSLSEPPEYSFDRGAWVTIGRNYRLDELKRDILLQLEPDMEISLAGGAEEPDFGRYLNEILKAIKCLIVLDDVWDTDIMDHLMSSLPEEGKCRVLLTTRLQHVALSDYATVFEIKLLNKEESWDLLRERVFGEELCPPELERDGKKIAENCDGLPLMIVKVAESLSKAERTSEFWNKVAENKTCSFFMDAYDQLSEVLRPSYEFLPQHLKPCFLQMGVFPPSREISKYKLLSMWTSEKLVIQHREQIFEKHARICLSRLLSHSVVMRCQKNHRYFDEMDFGFYAYAKTYRLHSSFWYLCCKEARESKFYHVLSNIGDVVEESMKSQRRLSMLNNILFAINNVHDSIVDACGSTARSLLFYVPYNPFQVRTCFNLGLLRVLDALQIRFYEFPVQVLKLIHLKYLALTCNNNLPDSIAKLLNLEFLIVHRHMSIKAQGDVLYVPIEIWDMEELKHIQIMGSNLPKPRRHHSLQNLLRLIGARAETCTKEVFERISNLQKLGIQLELYPNDDMKALDCLNNIHVLRELRSFKCIIVNPMLRSEMVSLPSHLPMFPSGLKKLHLSGLAYPWEYMSVIGSLPKLQVLKLRCYAFRGPKWVVKGDEYIFPSLTHLVIEDTDLVHFKVECGGFVLIRTIYLKNCYKLVDMQWNSHDCPYKIELIDCSPLIVASANEMARRGNSNKCFVHSSWEDRNSS